MPVLIMGPDSGGNVLSFIWCHFHRALFTNFGLEVSLPQLSEYKVDSIIDKLIDMGLTAWNIYYIAVMDLRVHILYDCVVTWVLPFMI